MKEVIAEQLYGDFEKSLFAAALGNLNDLENPLRLNNFAYAMRELVRHVMARLAPDKEVHNCTWYEEKTGCHKRISRRQRMYYAVQGGLSNEYVNEELDLDIRDIHRQLRDAIDNLNKYTHIEEVTFNLGIGVVDQCVNQTLGAVVEFFQTIADCRRALVNALAEHIDSSVVDEALSETILSIDQLATHHSVDSIYTENVQIKQIDAHFIHFVAEGTIECELQWGSNSDLRRGDGATLDQSFPFSCELTSPVDEPSAVTVEDNAFAVDTSSWWEGYSDD